MAEIDTNIEVQVNDGFALNSDIPDEFEKSVIYYAIKRIIDFAGSLAGLILLSPFLIVIAIIIKIESSGPVFFIQDRVGKNGVVFRMFKFRSMCEDAECKLKELEEQNEMSGPMFKMKCDPRVTKVGKFIRRTSIDELPQLINVLKGDMSLVGPRPNLPREVSQFDDEHMLKLYAKPGLTCYWQVSGRNDIGFDEWMELDSKYIRERNTWVDLKLIFKTVWLMFCEDGAR